MTKTESINSFENWKQNLYTIWLDANFAPFKSPAVRRAVVLRAPSTSTTIWPGEFIEIAVPDGIPDNVYAINIIEKHNTIDQEGKPLDSTWRALFNVQN